MRYYILPLAMLLFHACNPLGSENDGVSDFTTLFEQSKGTETPTYTAVIDFYKKLANTYAAIDIQTVGNTDSGYPLHLVTLNPDKVFDFNSLRTNKNILLINNGIHPGESDGIDATMLLFRDIAQGNIQVSTNTVICTIPIYNIGGALNRNTGTRTNQNGPNTHGFRGNARNYDLNRDFIKSDSKNAQAFASIFHLVQPDVFIDNHVSNGADYQYTLTHLFTQHNKLGGALGAYLHQQLQPQLEAALAKKNWSITPYVNVWNTTPDHGWTQFMDSPRYSTGYTTLWHTLGMMVETHMLKPYKDRVEGTYALMQSMIQIIEKDGTTIRQLRKHAFESFSKQTTYATNWKIDSTKSTQLQFEGYEGSYIDSKITGQKRLSYDTTKPYTKDITYQNYFTPSSHITVPKAYTIPSGWWHIIDKLKQQRIQYRTLPKDTTITVEVYHIDTYKNTTTPYEGHYLHKNTTVKTSTETVILPKGTVWVPTQQRGFRYIIETLEPTAPDSFFNWNFFDTILQQKEGFSPYVWEDKAYTILRKNDTLRALFEQQKKDSSFAKNAYAQLDWIHKHTVHYEKAHLRYPVYRVLRTN